jgi:3',5'-cyclic AMP phosphodiesterase CpdA
MSAFRVLILSDLHLHNGIDDDGIPSYLSSLPTLRSPKRNPLEGIPELLENENIQPDWIICPGDLGDKCDQLAQKEAWESLNRLKRKIKARKLIATVGNHDVDSRRVDPDSRPNDFLLALTPLFPMSPRRDAERYWRENFAYVHNDAADLTLLVLNSCVLHGVAAASGEHEEFKYGRVPARTLDRIMETINPRLRSKNLLLVHHHIRQHPWLPNEHSHMQNGPALLEVLKATGRQWLVVHGHQHLPNLSYAEGGTLAPIIFSSGSVAAPTTVVRAKRPRNQMYCVEFDCAGVSSHELIGRVYAWDWFPYVGWQLASRDSGLPHRCGFGFRGPLNLLASQIAAHASMAASHHVRWDEVISLFAATKHLIPEDVDALVHILQSQGAIVDFDRWGVPSAIGMKGGSNARTVAI